MKEKTYFTLTGILFGAKSVFGIYYLISGWDASVGPWIIPMWLIVVAVIFDGFLAYVALKLAKIIK